MDKILDELRELHRKLDSIMAAIEKFWPGLLQGKKIKSK